MNPTDLPPYPTFNEVVRNHAGAPPSHKTHRLPPYPFSKPIAPTRGSREGAGKEPSLAIDQKWRADRSKNVNFPVGFYTIYKLMLFQRPIFPDRSFQTFFQAPTMTNGCVVQASGSLKACTVEQNMNRKKLGTAVHEKTLFLQHRKVFPNP